MTNPLIRQKTYIAITVPTALAAFSVRAVPSATAVKTVPVARAALIAIIVMVLITAIAVPVARIALIVSNAMVYMVNNSTYLTNSLQRKSTLRLKNPLVSNFLDKSE